MVQLLSVVGVVVSALTFGAVAFPTGPGTCLVSGMAGIPHGSKATTGGNYSLTIGPMPSALANNTTANMTANTTTTSYKITINGSGTFTGLLLYAQDTANNNTRFGAFVKPPVGFGPHRVCKGVNPAANTLGHITANVKKFPLTLTWTPAGYNPAKQFVASFTGIVMTANAKAWYVLDPQSIGSTPSIATSLSSASLAPAASTSALTTAANASATATTSGTSSAATPPPRSRVSSLVLVALFSVVALWL